MGTAKKQKTARQKHRKLKTEKKIGAPLHDTTAEARLLARIEENSRLPDKTQKRFNQLRRRLHAETLTQSEEVELQKLWQTVEQMNVNRLEALIELSQKRGTDLHTLMDELGIGKNNEVF
jgi:hypothetical protein